MIGDRRLPSGWWRCDAFPENRLRDAEGVERVAEEWWVDASDSMRWRCPDCDVVSAHGAVFGPNGVEHNAACPRVAEAES
jgi:hypothetical protein